MEFLPKSIKNQYIKIPAFKELAIAVVLLAFLSPKISFFEQLNYLLLYTLVPIAHADRIFELENSLINTKNIFSLLSFLPIVLILKHYIKQNTKIFKTLLFTPIIILIIIFCLL